VPLYLFQKANGNLGRCLFRKYFAKCPDRCHLYKYLSSPRFWVKYIANPFATLNSQTSCIIMNHLVVLSYLLVSGVQANLVPRQDKPLQTASVPIPTEAEPFTTTIARCDETVAPIVFVGVPTGTFSTFNLRCLL